MKEGLQSSVRSPFAEIPGLPNVGSPVNLKKNSNGVIGGAILAEVAEIWTQPGCFVQTVVPSFLLGMRARPNVSRETPWGQ